MGLWGNVFRSVHTNDSIVPYYTRRRDATVIETALRVDANPMPCEMEAFTRMLLSNASILEVCDGLEQTCLF
jgi:hypothetical protein